MSDIDRGTIYETEVEITDPAPEDLNDQKDVKARRKTGKLAERRRLDYLVQVMSTPDGRNFIYEILTWCRVGATPFSTNSLIMAHNCGELNIGNRLVADIGVACPRRYFEMMQEAAPMTENPDV